MDMNDVAKRGLVLLGCGKMGSAMLAGWLRNGLPAKSVWVVEPHPSDWLKAQGVNIGGDLPDDPAIALVAVKPQVMAEVLPNVKSMGGGTTLVISVAAGTPIRTFEDMLGSSTPIIRAMPNTPAAIGHGITALIGNGVIKSEDMELAEALLWSIGQTVRLDNEEQMDAVTAVSGSGPAYVFHLIETLAAAGESEGLPAELAMELAKATVGGAGDLAENSDDDPAQLRVNVTSPNGTTQSALEVLMAEDGGLADLMKRTVAAAAARSRELANE
ncbi:pyrroline-5-carboxylate reductase [Loktanella sp. S4079]|uniref:pyrroline-5-carboxylate reductase n=1 Tax=Loktanella sp. S4079 TaxID=579483 RepID=UPI0005FA2136|nr:pyrroline-5-carboxylate reductase [Loktanella sp. S4079]KJZ19760.1 pyrroline-5-carboxylate reductase [Loktanella sp. S4079]